MINNFIANISHKLPKSFIGKIASKYVAGESLESGITCVKNLNAKGYCGTLNLLGEESKHANDTRIITQSYIQLLDGIHTSKIDCNVSLKLTALGSKIDTELCWSNLKTILHKAKETNTFVRIEMENSLETQKTIDMSLKAKEYYDNCGTVLQACLYRTQNDVNTLFNDSGTNIRLCKGAYKEDPSKSYQDYRTIFENYISCSKKMLDSNIYTCFATHDVTIINELVHYIESTGTCKNSYEFQSLFGVPIESTLQSLIENGHKVRYYVPYGPDWYEFSLRRLRENPDAWKNSLKAFI